MKRLMLRLAGVLGAVLCWFGVTDGQEYRLVPKPSLPKAIRRVLPPADKAFDDWKRVPYTETAAEPVPTAVEKQAGFILFSRPLIDAIYPETRPRNDERVTTIRGFGAWEQYETLNFALYPLADLKGINVQVGSLSCGKHLISSDRIEIRLVTYRDNTYPQYNSRGAYRTLPEYLQKVTTSDAPKAEPQRFCVTIQAPKGIPAGLYQGDVLISHNGFDRAVALRIVYEVFPFELKRDPAKNFSAYYYPPHRHVWVENKLKDSAWADKVLENDFKTMAKYGFTVPPVWYLNSREENGKIKLDVENADRLLALMKENGMHGPVPVIGWTIIGLAEKMTGRGIGGHVIVHKLPPKAYYDEVAAIAADFQRLCQEKKYPQLVFGPLDEIAGNDKSITFAYGVYESLKKGGLTTYTTMEPENQGYPKLDRVIDIFATQAYLPTYAETATRKKAGYWCYPNHNSYERKDPIIMNKGGRMTYGYGYWRSGFDMLLPWIWRKPDPKHFHEKKGSGGGNIVHPDSGEIITTMYWENFREGINDLNYIYTLQDALIRREKSSDPNVSRLVADAKKFLQETWDAIDVQVKYLAAGLWPSEEFDGRRYAMAKAISQLRLYPESSDRIAPSVVIEPRDVKRERLEPIDIYRRERKRNNVEHKSLLYPAMDKLGWQPTEDEAAIEIRSGVPGAKNDKSLVLAVNVDLVHDGTGGKGSYPAGWPAMQCRAHEKIVFGDYDLFFYRYKLETNRPQDGQAKPADFYCNVRYASGRFDAGYRGLGLEGIWSESAHTFDGKFYDGISIDTAPFAGIRLGISESSYSQGDKVRFIFDDICFVSFKKPFISALDVPAMVSGSADSFGFVVNIMGRLTKKNRLKISLLDAGEKPVWLREYPCQGKRIQGRIRYDEKLAPGTYRFKAELLDDTETVLSSQVTKVQIRQANSLWE